MQNNKKTLRIDKKLVDIIGKIRFYSSCQVERLLFFFPRTDFSGGVAERSNATDCKSVDFSLRWFESIPLHQLKSS